MTERSKQSQKTTQPGKRQLSLRETTIEKSTGTKALGTFVSLESQGTAKSTAKSQVPQNFNSFRHVITNSTTGDDVQWIVHLREMKLAQGKPV